MTDSPRLLQVFLCHSSEDRVAVRNLFDLLLQEDVEPWLDQENLLPGQQWQKEIPAAVRRADIVLVCLTQRAVTKAGYLQREIKLALDVADEQPEGAIFVIPVKLEECQVPERLRHLQWVNLFEDCGYERLICALEERAKKLWQDASAKIVLPAQKRPNVKQTEITGHAAGIVSRFRALGARILVENDPYALIELNLSSVFRRLDAPVLMFLTNSSIVGAVGERKTEINDAVIAHAKGDLIPIAVSDYSKKIAQIIGKLLMFGQQLVFPLQELFTSGTAHEIWRDVLLSHANHSLLVPFNTSRSATGDMFFGRQSSLAHLRQLQGCCFIVGSRRIGKSSLALQLRNELRRLGQLKVGGIRMESCSYLDVSAIGSNPNDIWGAILRGFGLDSDMYRRHGRRLRFKSTPSHAFEMTDAGYVLQQLISSLEGKLTILLDEVDGLIVKDAENGWPIFERLRGITDQGRARVILLGYDSLQAAFANERFPIAMRGDMMLLGPLSRGAFNKLITEPLLELRITIEPEDEVLNTFWQHTSGMPHLVQDVCSHLVMLAFMRKIRVLTLSELSIACTESQMLQRFRRGVIGCDFPLAEALSYAAVLLLTDEQRNEMPIDINVSIDRLISKLCEFGYTSNSKEIDLALSYLELRTIMTPVDSSRAMWTWINSFRYEAARNYLLGLGADRCLHDLLSQHDKGDWRGRYKRVGILN